MTKEITPSIKDRISWIKSAVSAEDLEKSVCPFFEKGGCPECIACDKSEASLTECKSIYLERIISNPMDVWDESFEQPMSIGREVVSPGEVVGIGINCNRCYMSDKCPLFKKDYVCGIDWGSSKPSTPIEFMDFLVDLQYSRVKRQSIFEKMDGGVPDVGLSGEMDRLSSLIYSRVNLNRERLSISVEASSPGSSTTGGILSKLFGGGGALPEKSAVVEDIPLEEIKEEPVKRLRKHKETDS